VIVCSEFNTERSGNDFLEHSEGKNIMRQTNECVVRSHIGEHMQTVLPNHELQRACTWNVFVLLYDVGCVEQLNDSLPRIRFFSKVGDNIGDLIVTAPHGEHSRPVSTIDCPTVVGVLFIMLQIVANEPKIICLRQVPQELS
jgi:hypothetical protein